MITPGNRTDLLIRCDPALGRLCDRLLAAGGSGVVLEPDAPAVVRALIARGRFFSGTSVLRVSAEEILQIDPDDLQIVLGYARSPGGSWRRHTWGLLDAEVVEPGPGYALYYGVPLSDGGVSLAYPLEAHPLKDALLAALHAERVRRTLELGEMCLKQEV